MTKPSITKLHPEMECFRCHGGLFDVEPCDLHLNVGCRGRFLPQAIDCESRRCEFTVIAVQKNYRGEPCYRILPDCDRRGFGQVARPDEVQITKDQDA